MGKQHHESFVYGMVKNFHLYSAGCAIESVSNPIDMAVYAGEFMKKLDLKMPVSERDVADFEARTEQLRDEPGFDEYVSALRKAFLGEGSPEGL
jgi:hypothetical protein